MSRYTRSSLILSPGAPGGGHRPDTDTLSVLARVEHVCLCDRLIVTSGIDVQEFMLHAVDELVEPADSSAYLFLADIGVCVGPLDHDVVSQPAQEPIDIARVNVGEIAPSPNRDQPSVSLLL